jgi:hypothetical protein
LFLSGSRTVRQFGSISIAGSIVVYYGQRSVFQIAAGIGLVFGASAVLAIVCGSILMIRETLLAVKGLDYEAKAHIRPQA